MTASSFSVSRSRRSARSARRLLRSSSSKAIPYDRPVAPVISRWSQAVSLRFSRSLGDSIAGTFSVKVGALDHEGSSWRETQGSLARVATGQEILSPRSRACVPHSASRATRRSRLSLTASRPVRIGSWMARFWSLTEGRGAHYRSATNAHVIPRSLSSSSSSRRAGCWRTPSWHTSASRTLPLYLRRS